MRYEGKYTQAISFPLGGIGTGSIGLAGNGMLIDWEIKNRPNKCSNNGFSFFAVKAEKDGKVIDARVLNGDLPTPYQGMPHVENFSGYGFGPFRCTMAGVPHFSKHCFDGSFPFAEISFEEDRFPGKAKLKAYNPMIPTNEYDSGIPAAFFTVEITNDTKDELDYIIAGALENPNAKGINTAHRDGEFRYLKFDGADKEKDDIGFGNLCLATDSCDCSLQEYWFRGAWFDALGVFWQDFNKPGLIRERTYNSGTVEGYPGTHDVGTITARIHLLPGETGSVRFVLSWYYPNNENYWNPLCEDEASGLLKNKWKNYYATCFESSEDAAKYGLKNWERLDRETRTFHDALFATTIPDYALDAVSSTMSVLKTPTCLRLEDGSFYGWEGLHSTAGSCEGTCTHVWNYAYAMPFLFPALERNLRETNYAYNQDEFGGMRFRTQIPLGRPFSSFRPCADGQFGDVMKTYREWKLCGDNEWLRKLWPKVKKSVEYAWSDGNRDLWDMNRDGVLEGRQHHTLDVELFGPSGWLNGFYLGALKAASEMAEAMDDQPAAEEFKRVYESGRKWVDENLFNGEYYGQKVDLKDREALRIYGEDAYNTYWNSEANEVKYQIDQGCSIDQITGQWHASLIGLKDILDPAHVKSAAKAIYRHNFMSMREHFNPCRLYSLNDEKGTVMCAWPEGTDKPVIPVPYAEETMYGFEYQAASSMILSGLIDEGLELVRSIRARHDGDRRNPWNEMECGSNYARSMASYSVLLALSGFTFDLTRGYIGFEPRISPDAFKTFWSVDGAWGTYEQNREGAVLRVLYGTLNLKSLKAGKAPLNAKAAVNGNAVACSVRDGETVFENALKLTQNDALTVC